MNKSFLIDASFDFNNFILSTVEGPLTSYKVAASDSLSVPIFARDATKLSAFLDALDPIL